MVSFSVVVLTVVLAIVATSAREPSTKVLEMFPGYQDVYMHELENLHRVSRQSRSCGVKLVQRVKDLCGTCTTDNDIPTFACTAPRSDAELMNHCCPNKVEAVQKKRAMPKAYTCDDKVFEHVYRACGPPGCTDFVTSYAILSKMICRQQHITDDFVEQVCCPKF